MCQSKAEGGRRCAYHLEQGVVSGMTTYVVAVTGLTFKEASAAYDALETEGRTAAAPTRHEVDEFLEKQIFRVRHEPDLTEKRRESIIARLRAAIGRILPSGATFHAWKNLVAESWSRVRRKAATAFVAGVLTFSVVGCGNADTSAPEAPRAEHVAGSTATQAPEAQYDTTWADGEVTIDKKAEAKYGTEGVTSAVTATHDLIRGNAFDSDLILGTREESKTRLLAIADQMTQDAKADWLPAVDKYTRGVDDLEATTKVFSQAFVALHPSGATIDGQPVNAPTSGPGVINQQVASTKVKLLQDGRLKIDVKSTCDLRVSVGETPTLWHFTRDTSYYVEQTPDGWKIDGWNSSYKGGDSRPE